MTTAEKPTTNITPAKANWEHVSLERELAVWQVAALAMGINPTLKDVKLARLSETTDVDYLRIRSFLSRRLRDEPTHGYVQYFPDHPYNQGKNGAHAKMVDVVSCIDVLKDAATFQLPPEFIDMRENLAKRPLSIPVRAPTKIVVTANTGPVSSQGESKKRDTSTSVSTRLDAQHALLVFALATSVFKYDANGTKTDKDRVITAILEKLAENQFIGNGLGKSAIEKSLDIGFKHAKDKRVYG